MAARPSLCYDQEEITTIMTLPQSDLSAVISVFVCRHAFVRKAVVPSLFAVAALAGFASRASAVTFVNFADPDAPAALTAFFHVNGGATNYITGTNPVALAEGGVANFNATAMVGGANLGFSLSLYDDGLQAVIPALLNQAGFYLSNYSGTEITVAAGALQFGVSGLYALDGQPLDAVFDYTFFSEGADAIAAGWVPHYDVEAGEFYFTNAVEFVVPDSTIVIFNGNFAIAAVPEPSTSALLLGGATMIVALCRRRRTGAF